MTNSFKIFGLDEKIEKALDKLGYEKPTKIQEEAIPLIFEKKDLVGKAQTGSGKTAAFGIPICEKVGIEENNPQALVLVPTRELAVQVKEEFSNIGRFKRIRSEAVFGKDSMKRQEVKLKQRVHILVGTPGRTLDHIKRGNIHLDEIQYLVLDEADKMLNMGFIEQVEEVIEALPKERTTLLFSATMPEKILNLCDQYMKDPKFIEVDAENLTTEKIEQYHYRVEEKERFGLLSKLMYTYRPESCILFCNTKNTVHWLMQKMEGKGFDCKALHGGMEQEDRLEVMKNFKRGAFPFLVATDVAARGIDIEDVNLIINFDVPVERESYIHRIGRTGRAGSSGIAITFVTPRESRLFSQIENYIGYEIPTKEEPSQKEVEEGKKLFKNQINKKPILKEDKGTQLDKQIEKIYIKAGRNKKIRPGDILGAITNIEGITSDDIGIIDIQDNISYVDILNGKGATVLKELSRSTIKGKRIKVQRAIN